MNTKVCPATSRAIDSGVQKRVAHPLVGATLDDRYRVGPVIGRGGAGIVFAGENIRLGRPVAVKVVADPELTVACERLQREARIISSLQHPNVCDVYDFGSVIGICPYLVMERLHGETIAQRVRTKRRFSVGAVAEIISQILSALQAAHASGIVHRDLKPQNVFLVDRLGCGPLVKILDFGLAKDLSVQTSLTRAGRVVGTPEYLSPEQLTAQPASPSMDMFAIGIIMYEMLTGRHPFAASSRLEIQMRILHERPDPMNVPGMRPMIPRRIEDIVLRALEKQPQRRFANPYAMQRELRRAMLPLVSQDHACEESAPASTDTGTT